MANIEFQERSAQLAYLKTIWTYGTWLHGDSRGSVDRREYNRYGDTKIAASELYESRDREAMKFTAFKLNAESRSGC